jgi:hypothetical protein
MATLYYGGDPSMNPMAGAAAASSQNQSYNAATLQGYKDRLNAWNTSMQAMDKGFNAVLARQDQFGESQRMGLDSDYARQQAQMQASMLGRGLYNSTVYDSAQRGLGYDQARANIDLGGQILNNKNQINMSRLQYQQGAYGNQDAIRGQQLQFMGSLNAQPIQNQVIPWNYWQPGGQGYEMQRQAQYQYNPMAGRSSLASGDPSMPFGVGGGGGGGSFTQPSGSGFDPNQRTNAQWGLTGGIGNMPFGTGLGGGSLLKPSGYTGGYYVGGGGWGAAPPAQDYGYSGGY